MNMLVAHILCRICFLQVCVYCMPVPPAYYAHLAAFRARLYTQADVLDGRSTSASARNTQVQPLPSIKENLKDVMFFA